MTTTLEKVAAATSGWRVEYRAADGCWRILHFSTLLGESFVTEHEARERMTHLRATAAVAAMGQKTTGDRCRVEDGLFVIPCTTLDTNTDMLTGGFSKAKGLTRWTYRNIKTHEPSRTFFGVKTKATPQGICFNHCPFCGVQIDAPFLDGDIK